jgi:hypothetical protein
VVKKVNINRLRARFQEYFIKKKIKKIKIKEGGGGGGIW